jgi:hypothetical protein
MQVGIAGQRGEPAREFRDGGVVDQLHGEAQRDPERDRQHGQQRAAARARRGGEPSERRARNAHLQRALSHRPP